MMLLYAMLKVNSQIGKMNDSILANQKAIKQIAEDLAVVKERLR